MHLIALHLNAILFSLVSASLHLSDVKYSSSNPRLPQSSSNTPIPNKLEIHVHGTLENLNIECLTTEKYRYHPSNTEYTPSPTGWHTVGICIMCILLVSVAWPLWKYLENNVQNSHLTRRAGRSEAVSGTTPREDSPLRHDQNLSKHYPRRRRCAAVMSADGGSNHTPPLRDCTVFTTRFGRTEGFEGRNTAPPSPLREEPKELDAGTATNPQRPPRPHTFHKVVADGPHVPRIRTWSWPPISRSKSPVVFPSTRLADPYSLHRSLHKGTRDLDEDPLELDRCMFIVVGVDTPNHEDAANDARYLQQMFEFPTHGSSTPRYKCIYGTNVTLISIRQAVQTFLGEARALPAPPQIFMLFTGTGDKNNAMCLSTNETMSESDLINWLTPPDDESNEPTVHSLFDICRQATSRPAAILRRVKMAWSCSEGELAYAVRLSKHEDKLFPRSIFLLAIFLAAHDTRVHNQDAQLFEVAFMFHMKQLSKLIEFAYNRGHQDRCARCPAHKRCDPPLAQNPDLQHAGRAVTNLGMIIVTQFSEHACEVFTEVTRKMKAGGFPARSFDPSVVQAVKSRTRVDGSYLNSRTASRAKARFASVEARPVSGAY